MGAGGDDCCGYLDEEESARGSGYPSDPRTQAYLKEMVDPVFGYKGIARFSWATIRVILESRGIECRWYVHYHLHVGLIIQEKVVELIRSGSMIALNHQRLIILRQVLITVGQKYGEI